MKKPAGYEKDILSKLNGASHLLKCGHCGKGLRRKGVARCGVHEFNCSSCESKQYDLGPLPIPDANMPMGGIVTAMDVPQGKSGEVIKWFCSWCGCTVGDAKKCTRCSCDLSLVPPQYGAVFVAGGEGLAESLYVQAATPMSVSVALVRLGRATVKSALKTGATEEYAQSMQPEEAPPTALTKD
ncbi:MAG: hypothetical protein HRU15_13180 [Planctomycetes bacterium]|nr:hypothetical protein [Planctomycetota bacterium]